MSIAWVECVGRMSVGGCGVLVCLRLCFGWEFWGSLHWVMGEELFRSFSVLVFV